MQTINLSIERSYVFNIFVQDRNSDLRFFKTTDGREDHACKNIVLQRLILDLLE